MAGQEKLPLEVQGITVVPHVVSGEIPDYPDEAKYLSKFSPGALVRIFVRNTGAADTLDPDVLFNGKTCEELLSSGIISYGDAPGIRRSQTNLSTLLPPGAMDGYLLNVVNSDFYKNGLELSLTAGNKTVTHQLQVVPPSVYAARILFSSSTGSLVPDGFYVYLKSDRNSKISFHRIKLWKPGKSWKEHWWADPQTLKISEWFGEKENLQPGELNGAYVHTGPLPFGEIVLELELGSGKDQVSLFYPVKPWVVRFDFGMGWAEKYLAGSEAFCKTMKLLHLNTVNGNAGAFFKNSGLAQKYEVKKFAKLEDVEGQNRYENLEKIHGAEHFGEPQFDKKPAQGIYNYYTTYRHSGYPTTLTLSHEPGFFLYAGVVDFPHFDAYRVVAPHADRWGYYEKYGEKNVRWGSPLETIGDYMRTLHRISMPSPVAAWTQGMSDGWKSRARPGAGNPNPLEMRIQACEAVANGALSLYWFNMSGKNIIDNRGSLPEIQRINREIKTVGSLLVKTVPSWWENHFKNLDLNVLAGPDFAILFAIDLRYGISAENQFVSAGERAETMEFKLPAYLHTVDACVKVSHSGVTEIQVIRNSSGVTLSDRFTDTGLYLVYHSKKGDLGELLEKSYRKAVEDETSVSFDPIRNDGDFRILREEVLKLDEKK